MTSRALALLAASLVLAARVTFAQEPPPRIGPYVVDLHGTIPKFSSNPQLAPSRGLDPAELPGVGLGATAGVHVYLFKVGAVTVGVGGEVTYGRAHFTPPESASGTSTTLVAVSETFKSASPQLSLNFGSGNGWSYLSAGVGRSIWTIQPEGAASAGTDEEPINTFNYGGGARWFIKPHLAFSLDVRLHEIRPAATQPSGLPGNPHMLLLFISAGISVK